MDARYITSALKPEQLPAYDLPEIAFIGRSNCGKSSLLNALLNRQNLARTSRTPGRTQLVNFFGVDQSIIFADLPGYGFNVAETETTQHWESLMDAYFRRPNIKELLFLADCRRDLDSVDLNFITLLAQYRPVLVVLTKADKLNQRERHLATQKIKTLLDEEGVPCTDIVIVSSMKKLGIDPLRERLFQYKAQKA